MMDFAAREAGIDNLTSPADMLLFLQELEQGTLLSLPSRAAILASLAANQDDQKIPALLPPETLVQNKIGVLPAVEHDVALVTTPDGRCYALVLMSRDLASNAAGIRASAQASRLVFDYEQQLTLRETDTTTDEE
jgi:beta-lactamase class A